MVAPPLLIKKDPFESVSYPVAYPNKQVSQVDEDTLHVQLHVCNLGVILSQFAAHPDGLMHVR